MRKDIILLIIIALSCSSMFSQFPTFTNYEGSKVYSDSSEQNRLYRDFYQLGNKVDSEYAYILAVDLNAKIEVLKKRIDVTNIDSILNYSQRNDSIVKMRDSIEFLTKAENYYSSINKFTGTPKIQAGFFPVTIAKYAKFFYQGSERAKSVNFFSDFIVQTNLDRTAISSNLISGVASIFQIAISTTVTEDNNVVEKDKINNKILYGGLFNSKVVYPIFYKSTSQYALYIPAHYQISVDNIEIDETVETKNIFYFGDLGASVYVRIPVRYTDYNDNVSIFFNSKNSYIHGGDSFYKKFSENSREFFVSQGIVGVEIDGNIRIALNFPIYSSVKSVISRQPSTIGFQIDPKILAAKN